MDIDSFWDLIEQCRQQALGRDDRLAWLREELTRRGPGEAVQFQLHLDRVIEEAFTWDLWAAAERIFEGWCSDDGFCYFRLWLVGLGREAFEEAMSGPDSLARVTEVRRLAGRPLRSWGDEWPEWESLDYVAMEAYAALTGVKDDGEAFYDAFDARQNGGPVRPAPAGQRWDVRQEDEVVRRLPQLSAMFPLPVRE
ncbi:DUF4240 domain-containing protein [Streptomyces sp. NPDC049597]|uniref:DUF4240 domain-containing protein n=1 Tax=Streptomyces sp. NPDC049597 TaxID=3155276 RepID=UPI00341ADDCD